MFNRFGASEVGWCWMSEAGGSLGGDPAGEGASPPTPGVPSTGGGGQVDPSPSGAEGAGEGLAGQAAGAGGQPSTEPAPSAPQQPQSDWRDKRIATLTRRLKEFQERGNGQQQPQQQSPQGFSQSDIDRLAEQRARELAITHEFNRRCDEVAVLGRSSFGENNFNERISNLQKLVDANDPSSVQAYNLFLSAAIDTGEAAKLLHSLGSDLDEAQRIMSLPGTRMAVELMKRAMTPEVQVSNAPRPITPVGGRGVSHEAISPDDPDRSDHLSVQEWMRRREMQVSERNQARVRNGFRG